MHDDLIRSAREELADSRVTPASSAPGEKPGDRIDRYRLLQSIGHGGMGSVWLAEQHEPVKRKVALKIIKLGMDTREVIARFEAERQALAMMDHPHIAKVLDGGATAGGRPFFVMELVKGIPITEYCDKAKLRVRERLALFSSVCEALHHAHQKGIIHRDVKPSNVLVTLHDGVPYPKVIDFGIAKATNVELTQKTLFTQHAQIIGTPEYMAPEQAELSGLDIDTRADVYSLGVLLYELLTGTKPFDVEGAREAGFQELLRTIREDDPAKPSTRISTLGQAASPIAVKRAVNVDGLRKRLRGDLDWIVLKALEKDRTRRYESAIGFAQDVERYLADEPVLAAPPGAWYRMSKLLRRRKKTVASTSAIVVLLISGSVGTGVFGWRAHEASRELRGTNTRLEAANEQLTAREGQLRGMLEERRQTVEFQESQLRIPFERLEPKISDAVLRAGFAGDRAAFDRSMAGVDFKTMGVHIMNALVFEPTLLATEGVSNPAIRSRLLQATASTMRDGDLLDAALDPQKRAVALRREAGGDEELLNESVSELGYLHLLRDEYAEARECFREVLAARTAVGEKLPASLRTRLNLAVIGYEELVHLGVEDAERIAELERLLTAIIEDCRSELPPEHETTAWAHNTLASLRREQARYEDRLPAHHLLDEALAQFRRAREIHFRRGDDLAKLTVDINIAVIHADKDTERDRAAARAIFERVLGERRALLGDRNRATVDCLHRLARITDDRARKLELYHELVPVSGWLFGPASDQAKQSAGEYFELLVSGPSALAGSELAAVARRLGFDDPLVFRELKRLLLDDQRSELVPAELWRDFFPHLIVQAGQRRDMSSVVLLLKSERSHLGARLAAYELLVEFGHRESFGVRALRYIVEEEVEGVELGDALYEVGLGLAARSEYDYAETMFEESRQILDAGLPSGHWRRLELACELGFAVSKLGRASEAEALLLQNAAGLFEHAEAPASSVIRATERALAFCEEQATAAPDGEWAARVDEWRARAERLARGAR